MDSRIGIRSALFSDHRHSETPRAAVLACAFFALRTIRPRLELMVLGLDQGRASPHRIWNRFGFDLVCRNAAQSTAVVAVLLVPGGADSPWTDRRHPIGDRSAV